MAMGMGMGMTNILLLCRSISFAFSLLKACAVRAVERNHRFYSSSAEKETADERSFTYFIFQDTNKAGSLSRKPSPKPFASTEKLLFNSSPAEKDTLLHTIKSEIRNIDEMMELPDGFLLMVPNGFAFEIEYDREKQTILLVREYENEVIQVKTYLPHLVTKGEGEREGDDKDNEDKCSPLDVSVSKKNGTSLNFRCSACYKTGDIRVHSISLKKNLESSEDEGVLHDYTFNGKLQKLFHKYLEIRGINPNLAIFLFGYIFYKGRRGEKKGREYSMRLKMLKQFLEG